MLAPPVRTRSIDEMGVPAYRTYLDALGSAKMHAQRRFLSELPEVQARGLARTWGFESVHVFAAKVAGVSRAMVDEILALHRTLGEHTVLWDLLLTGQVGWSKLKTIKKVVDAKNASWWAEKVRTCSRRQLEDEVRRLEATHHSAENDDPDSVPGQNQVSTSEATKDCAANSEEPLGSDGETDLPPPPGPITRRATSLVVHPSATEMAMLEALRSQLSRQLERAVSLDEAARHAIRATVTGATSVEGATEADAEAEADAETEVGGTAPPRPPAPETSPGRRIPIPTMLVLYRNVDSGELRIPTRHGLVPAEIPRGAPVLSTARPASLSSLIDAARRTPTRPGSRHVPAAHGRLVAARFGNRCGFPDCLDPAENLHHLEPLSEGGDSSAENLVPLCLKHHDALHSGWILGAREDPSTWRYRPPGSFQTLGPADSARATRRQAAIEEGPSR